MPTGADQPGNASQDAGWARVVSADGMMDFGRGHLKIWMESPGSPGPAGRQAQLESFTSTEHELHAGDRVCVHPEAESAIYPVMIREYEQDKGSAAVLLDWLADDSLPATLLETGGERSGEGTTTATP